jgi:hypothetical protein
MLLVHQNPLYCMETYISMTVVIYILMTYVLGEETDDHRLHGFYGFSPLSIRVRWDVKPLTCGDVYGVVRVYVSRVRFEPAFR